MQKCQIHKFVFDTLLTSLLRGPMARTSGRGSYMDEKFFEKPQFLGWPQIKMLFEFD